MAENPPQNNIPTESFLGFSSDNFSKLGIKEIVGNEPAITMVMHYYKQLLDENKTLKNDLNTYKTYATAFERKTSNSATSAVLFLLSNVSVAFGVNLLTQSTPIVAGWFLLATGGLMAVAGLYFNFWKDK